MRACSLVVAVALCAGGCSADIRSEGANESGSDPKGGAAPGPGISPPANSTSGAGAPPPMASPLDGCSVDITPVSPPTFTDLPSGPGRSLRVQAVVTGVEAGAPLAWQWLVRFGEGAGTPVPTSPAGNVAAVEFALDKPGRYYITVAVNAPRGSCSAQRIAAAGESGPRLASFRVRITPPSSMPLPVQDQTLQVLGGKPADVRLVLHEGIKVTLDPQDQTGTRSVPSYVRLSPSGSTLVVEGHTARAPFLATVLSPLLYDVLFVPDGPIAPILHAQQTASALMVLPLRLPPGTAVAGRVTDATGAAVTDARVVLRAGALTSTVGQSDGAGSFELRVREGMFSAVVSAPPGLGLPDAQVGVRPGIAVKPGAAALAASFQWRALPTGRLGVIVRGSDGLTPAAGARVRIDLDPPLNNVGTLTVRDNGGAPTTLIATGTLRATALCDAFGMVDFPRLPRGRYRVMVTPPDRDTAAALTTLTADLTAADVPALAAPLGRRARVTGVLGPGDAAVGAVVYAQDAEGDLGRATVSAVVKAGGAFALDLDPGRRQRLWVDPGITRSLGRLLLGAITAPAEGLTLPERALPSGLAFTGSVTTERQGVVAGAVLQVFCEGTGPECLDPTIPLAEGVTSGNGGFALTVPDPGVR